MDGLTNDLACSCNYIKETIMKIDKLQKEAIADTTYYCVSCETSLLSATNNTIPVLFNSCSGSELTGSIGLTNTTKYFRIESIRCGQYITLRLLEATTQGEETVLTGTNYTMTVDLDCIKCIQCLEPISIEVCTQN